MDKVDIRQMILLLGDTRKKRVTKYVSKNYTVKVTKHGRWDNRDHQEIYLVTLGKPNYAERNFIKQAIKAGEPFPVKKLQLR